jgi:hypothetical protein
VFSLPLKGMQRPDAPAVQRPAAPGRIRTQQVDCVAAAAPL